MQSYNSDQHGLLFSSSLQPMNMDLDLAKAMERLPYPAISTTELFSVGSTRTSPIEKRLMLDCLAAESALEKYRYAKAEALAMRRGLACKRGTLRPALLPTALTVNALVAEPCAIPVSAFSSPLNAETGRVPSPELPSALYSVLCRPIGVPTLSETKTPLCDLERELQQAPPVPERRCSKCWGISFPSKLFNMLDDADRDGHADIVSFVPDGKAFMIHEPEKFAKEILPKYFRTKRLSSFQKQLSLYGFKRIRSGAKRGALRHEFLQRGDKKLIALIQLKRYRIQNGET